MMLLSLKYVYGVVPEVFRSLDLAIESCDAFNIFQVWSESSMFQILSFTHFLIDGYFTYGCKPSNFNP